MSVQCLGKNKIKKSKDRQNKGQKYGKDLREAKDIKKRWQEYTEETVQKRS